MEKSIDSGNSGNSSNSGNSKNIEKCSPVVLFVYNRAEHAKRTLTALAKCELAKKTPLVVFADGPKQGVTSEQQRAIDETRSVVYEVTREREREGICKRRYQRAEQE